MNQGRFSEEHKNRPFRWEYEMQEVVLREVDRLIYGRRGVSCVVAEMQGEVGVIDLLAIAFDDRALEQRIKAGIPAVTFPLRVQVLDQLTRPRPMRIDTLARRVGSNSRALTRSTLRPLAEIGAIEFGRETVCPTGAWQPVAVRLTAIELKLNKWKKALRQADNAAFAVDTAWVVLDAEHAGPAIAARTQFEMFGVGLALAGSDGSLRAIVPPARRRNVRWVRSWLGELAWAATERAAERDAETGAIVSGSAPFACAV
jgi:hypothetical protein